MIPTGGKGTAAETAVVCASRKGRSLFRSDKGDSEKMRGRVSHLIVLGSMSSSCSVPHCPSSQVLRSSDLILSPMPELPRLLMRVFGLVTGWTEHHHLLGANGSLVSSRNPATALVGAHGLSGVGRRQMSGIDALARMPRVPTSSETGDE